MERLAGSNMEQQQHNPPRAGLERLSNLEQQHHHHRLNDLDRLAGGSNMEHRQQSGSGMPDRMGSLERMAVSMERGFDRGLGGSSATLERVGMEQRGEAIERGEAMGLDRGREGQERSMGDYRKLLIEVMK